MRIPVRNGIAINIAVICMLACQLPLEIAASQIRISRAPGLPRPIKCVLLHFALTVIRHSPGGRRAFRRTKNEIRVYGIQVRSHVKIIRGSLHSLTVPLVS